MERPSDSRSQPSLDEIVTRNAAAIADQIRGAAALAKSEMDLQIDVAAALKKFAGDAKINMEPHHNVTIATGRPDSVYGSVIVEYKEPGKLSPNKEAGPNKAVIDQLKKRFYDMNREEHRQWNSMFGVGTDGKYFIFLRFRDDKWTDQEPLEVNRYSTERFLWALYNLGQKGKPYQPEYLNGDFGSDSQTAQEGVRALYEEILTTTNPKAQVFFNQWKILFGEVCGYDVENLSDKLNKLAEFYLVKGKTQPAQLLFAVHTYYAILIKLLASEIVSFFNPWMTRQVQRLQSANSSAKLKRELEDLEQGGVFHTLGITNFLEGDLFAWYLGAWGAPIEKLVRAMVTKLDLYNPGTFSEDPAQSRDLLKKLYQQLFPKSVRHDLGEYYTPDWLAEHVLNELGYEGDPDKRLLDPACGSGTFLVMAINRIRRWYDLNREKCAYDEGELLKKILTNVIGFDLNPLAVMAARTNYLVAIKDLIRHVEGVEIPVYLCDSIMTPAEYGDLFTGGQGKVAKVPCSAMKPPHLLVPKEIAQNPKDVATYALILEACVKNAYLADEFLSRCRDEGLNIAATQAHLDLYKELVKLDKANKNGIWARIIKNNFAPLFEGRESFDYVVGNPPWINWEYLPQSYREDIKELWQKYKLLPRKKGKGYLTESAVDFSVLFLYASIDAYSKTHGSFGFVITQSVFKSELRGQGFRRFALPDRSPLRPLSAQDFVQVKPFEFADNKTGVILLKKSEPTAYPFPYKVWHRTGNFSEDAPLEEVYKNMSFEELDAWPVSDDEGAPWVTGTKQIAGVLFRKLLGQSEYAPCIGIDTIGANSVYWVRVVKKTGKDAVLVENLFDIGDKHVTPKLAKVPVDLVYPLIRGQNIHRWNYDVKQFILLPHNADTGWRAIDPKELKSGRYYDTYSYFENFQDFLSSRPSYLARRKGHPFYIIMRVYKESFFPFKVIWKRMAQKVVACVASYWSDETLDNRPVMSSDTTTFLAFRDKEEAFYVCALLNSSICSVAVQAYASAGRGFGGTHVFKRVKFPLYKAGTAVHDKLAQMAESCHKLASKGNMQEVYALEAEIDKAAAKLWGITNDELKAIREALADTSKSERAVKDDEEEEEE